VTAEATATAMAEETSVATDGQSNGVVMEPAIVGAAATVVMAAPPAAKAAADAAAEGSTETQILDFRNFWWQIKQ
jgi:hypothetical protein